MTRTITLLTSGTRGDVQPYLALGLGLRDAGYHIRIATHDAFVPMVERVGLEHVRLSENPSDLFAKPGGEHALRFDGNPIQNLRASLKFIHDSQISSELMFDSAWRACQDSDALIIGLPTTWGAHIADALHIPHVRCFLQPFTPTHEFPSPLLPFTFSLGTKYNCMTYRIVQEIIWQSWRGIINRWRRNTLHLKPAPFFKHPDSSPMLYGFSPRIVSRPADYPGSHHIVGYWFLNSANDWSPSSNLQNFLSDGAPPVYIGFGSLKIDRPNETLALITRGLQANNLRAVLSVSHEFSSASLPQNIFPIRDVPHDWLFPQMFTIVHHGGAGTTGASLRAGIPTIVIPLAVDQFFWGARVAALGVGPQPIPQRNLTEEKLSRALHQATHDAQIKSRAQNLAREISKEDGVERAVELIRAIL
jgi:sterol 3beta-glucosyltransferase